MQFLLEQQAAAEARWAAADARQEQWKAEQQQWNTLHERRMAEFGKNQIAIQQTQVRQLEMINRLIDVSAEQTAAGKATDERLNALIAVVDGVVRRKN
jgi:ADP-ribosylglycohydrolase